jgi:MobA/MobL family protein
MAQYHFAATVVCRSKGQSAVAAAAYRAGVSLEDERLGKTFDYTRRRGVLHSEIRTPEKTPDWMRDRGQLFNAIEKAEKRKDSQLARSIDIALPYELSLEHNLELVRSFVDAQYVSRGMIADFAIHAPGRKGDIRNVHVHILLTTREIAGPGFGPKVREWNAKNELLEWRKAWADHANRILEREGFEERIDHRSLSDQGIDREPTTHVGPTGKEMEERGDVSDRAQKNRDIKAVNDNLAKAKKELAESEKRLADLKRQQVAERMERIQKFARAAHVLWQKAEQRWGQPTTAERTPEPELPAKQPEPPAATPRRPSRKRQSAGERMEGIQKVVRAAKAFSEKAEQLQSSMRRLHPDGAPPYPENSPPPVSVGGKAASMPDDLSEQQKLADNKRFEDQAKQNAERLVEAAAQIRVAQLGGLDAQRVGKARFDAYRSDQEKIAFDPRAKVDIERQQKIEAKAREGAIRDAGLRYGEALRQNYDMRDPYASLAKAAMAEYATFRKDREDLDQQIARTADPQERQALDLRKRIEGAEYLAITGDRIAQQSEIITGRRNSPEAVKEHTRAVGYRIQAQDLRQQLRELRQEKAPEKDQELDRTEAKAELEIVGRPGTPQPNQYAPLIKKMDDAAKAHEREAAEKDPERQTQQERERELQRKRDRER